MKFTLLFLAQLFATPAIASEQGGLPLCKAEVRDEMNQTVSSLVWREDLFIGKIEGASQPILISTSLGDNKIISLWVREPKEFPNGMFSFVDLSTGREQYFRFYMADRSSVQVICQWDPNP